MNIGEKLKGLKKDVAALYLAYKRPDVPVFAKVLAVIVVGYALSPIDLIPDFIPVLGYLDDLVLLPLGVALVVKMIPKDVMDECREQAAELFKDGKPKNWTAAIFIILIWAFIIGFVAFKLIEIFI